MYQFVAISWCGGPLGWTNGCSGNVGGRTRNLLDSQCNKYLFDGLLDIDTGSIVELVPLSCESVSRERWGRYLACLCVSSRPGYLQRFVHPVPLYLRLYFLVWTKLSTHYKSSPGLVALWFILRTMKGARNAVKWWRCTLATKGIGGRKGNNKKVIVDEATWQ